MNPASTASLSTVDQRGVDDLVLDELEHGAPRRQRQRPDGEQEVARDVDVGGPVADERVEAEVGEHARQQRRRHRLRRDRLVRIGDRPVQQLVRDDVPAGIEDRLPGDDDVAVVDLRAERRAGVFFFDVRHGTR